MPNAADEQRPTHNETRAAPKNLSGGPSAPVAYSGAQPATLARRCPGAMPAQPGKSDSRYDNTGESSKHEGPRTEINAQPLSTQEIQSQQPINARTRGNV
jgi:hypothetical protein